MEKLTYGKRCTKIAEIMATKVCDKNRTVEFISDYKTAAVEIVAIIANEIKQTFKIVNHTPDHWIDGYLIENGYMPEPDELRCKSCNIILEYENRHIGYCNNCMPV